MAGGEIPNRVYKTMTTIKWNDYIIRVWIDADKGDIGPDYDVLDKLKDLQTRFPKGGVSRQTVAEEISELSKVYRVEVRDYLGNGCTIYPNWK